MNHEIGIIQTASYLPSKVQTNEEVCKNIVGLTSEWILEKTGIKKRYHIGFFDDSFTMSSVVVRRLTKNIDTSKIGLIVVASFSQDYFFPPLSAYIHSVIKASRDCQVIDINVNCVGLVTGTTIAVERMKSNSNIEYAVVIGVEILSKYVNSTDKFTAPFFSDGCSGVLLGRVDKRDGFISSSFCTDSSVYEDVRLKRGEKIYQNGKTTWTQAITNLPYVMKSLVIDLSIVDFFIFHQANKVLIDYIMDKNKIPREKTYTNVEEIGNTGAASIGIALDEAMKEGLIKKNDLLMLVGVGAGFNFGANLWRM